MPYSTQARNDPALVRAVVILPIVVAGITMVVKYSIALAFALTGIVAAVRFRNTLKDPRDAVYIFLAIGIGLASGVQELDVALVTSMMFNLVMLTLWRYNIGSVYGGAYGRTTGPASRSSQSSGARSGSAGIGPGGAFRRVHRLPDPGDEHGHLVRDQAQVGVAGREHRQAGAQPRGRDEEERVLHLDHGLAHGH